MADAITRLNAALQGRYRVERELGEGGMARVYLAADLRHERRVALKVLRAELAAIVGGERFLAEIKTTANLQHPHILPLFDSGEADTFLFYVMPYVEGETLRDRLAREHQLPVEHAVHIATNVAEALDYAHRHGVIHRDIKPANVLLLDGKPVIADFGIALAVTAGGGGRLTETGLSLGTPHYMSPEQATGDQGVGPATDIWALGCVLYEMLVGEPPYTGTTPQAVLGKIISAEPPSLTAERKAAPRNVEAAVHKALEKLPADRFRTAQEFANALANPAFGATRGTERVTETALPLWRRRNLANWQVAALLLVVGALGGTGVWRGTGDPAAPSPTFSSILPPEGQDFSEAESFGALSPDGTRFAFVSLGLSGERLLWIRDLEDLDAGPLPGTEGAAAPFWSPDGREVAFFAQGWLQVVEVGAGATRRICSTPDAYSGSWGEGGGLAVASRAGIISVDLSGPTCRVAIAAAAAFDIRRPALLPDGRYVLFRWRRRDIDVGIGDLETGEISVLMLDAGEPTFVSPDLLVFSRVAGGVGGLWAQSFDPRGRALQGDPVLLSAGVRTAQGVASFAVSPGGTLLYQPGFGDRGYLLTDRRGEVIDTLRLPGVWNLQWGRNPRYIAAGAPTVETLNLYDLERGLATPITRSSSTSGLEPTWSPAWAPGDSLLAYAACDSVLACGVGIMRMADGADTLAVPPEEGYTVWPSSWSPDARFLVYARATSFTPAGAELWTYDWRENRATTLFAQPQRFSALEGAVSPDGRWIAYRSDETGTWEVFVRPFRGAGPSRRVSADGGRSPRWRADGRELFFQSPDGHVMAAAVTPGAELTLASGQILFVAPGWSRHNFHDIGTSYDVSPDGQRFVVRLTPTAPAAVLVQNWKSLLR